MPVHLTTGALSNHSHGVSLNLTNISGTTSGNSSGITLNLSAALGGGGADGYNILAAGTQTAGTAATINFANSNGITFGMTNSSRITASHNGLTTAAQSNHSHNFATTTTNGALIVVGTTNSAGATIAVPSFLTTAQPVGAYLTTARASNDAVGLNTALTAGPLAWTVNSSGISLNAGSAAGTSTGFAGNSISGSITHNTAGINISLNHPAWLTTAALSQDSSKYAGTSSGFTGGASISGSITHNTAGLAISLSHPAWLTTAANSTHSHGNPTLALTNISGTTASASNGFTLSLSAGAGGAGDGVNIVQMGAGGNSAGATYSASTGTVHLFGGPNITLSQNNNSISVSAAAPGGGGGAISQWYAMNRFHGIMSNITNLTGTYVTNRPLLFPFEVIGTLTADEIMWQMSRAATGSDNFTLRHGIYSYVNSSQISLISSRSEAYSFTATASNSGIRIWEATMPVTSLAPGNYVWAAIFSGGATASINYSLMGNATGSLLPVGVVHPGTNSNLTHASHQVIPFWGRFSTTTNGCPNSFGLSQVSGVGTNAIPLVFWMWRHQ